MLRAEKKGQLMDVGNRIKRQTSEVKAGRARELSELRRSIWEKING
jgi:hypothetical protein